MSKQTFTPNKIISYFKTERVVLLIVTVSGLIYNLGLLAGPWFEGRMTGCLIDILNGRKTFYNMLILVGCYVLSIAVVQVSRYIKRFYVRRFANNVNRRMKGILYASLVEKSRPELKEQGTGDIMTKAILDVDDCVEGMRKFTTEIFDTGIALAAYAGMLLYYDWRLALLSMLFPPVSYLLAEKMKAIVQRTGVVYKEQSGALSSATLDRAENAITYRVFGCEQQRKQAYEENLTAYEKAAVSANIWNTMMPPLYKVIPSRGQEMYLYDDKELERYRKSHTGDFRLQRYKGLGEMVPEQLWETTLDPERRVLKRVEIEDARMASEVTEMLMGSEVPPRRQFIYDHANEAEIDA